MTAIDICPECGKGEMIPDDPRICSECSFNETTDDRRGYAVEFLVTLGTDESESDRRGKRLYDLLLSALEPGEAIVSSEFYALLRD